MGTTSGRFWIIGLLLTMTALQQAHGNGSSTVQILSATVRDEKIVGATVILQRNGQQSASVTTDAQGRAAINDSAAADSTALMIVRMAGYSVLVAKCPCAGMTYALSPVMRSLDGMRVVLNWGAEPLDLDGHMAFPGNHVFFGQKEGADARLDVDHLDGFGPETITIDRKHSGERYVYAVQDFTDKANGASDRLSHSDAKVFVYIGETLIRVYYVPKNKVGNLWTVFAVSEQGEFQDLNTMSSISVQSIDELQTPVVFPGTFNDANRPAINRPPLAQPASSNILPEARKLNVQGESAYRAGDLQQAIQLFQSAVAEDDSYGQAYSNLGLAFQKAGRVAEALWANRKAIALASGSTASTTRAGTHFNNGRIYEEAHQWSDAAREYREAEQEKDNPVYLTAIARAQNHGTD